MSEFRIHPVIDTSNWEQLQSGEDNNLEDYWFNFATESSGLEKDTTTKPLTLAVNISVLLHMILRIFLVELYNLQIC